MTYRPLIYLDHNATTPCATEVLDAMLPWFREDCGNPSSVHVMGRRAARAVAQGRESVANAVGSTDEEIVFTSGATEANNLVLLGLADRQSARNRIVVTEIEHKSVLGPATWLSERGFEVVRLPVTRDGVVCVEEAEEAIDDRTLLVCIHGANNEIGTLQPVTAVAHIARSHGAFVHCDATQLLGKVPVSVDELGADFASFSSHKVYGPKGVGALYVRRGDARSSLRALHHGGSQENLLRAGTLNVPGIVGFGEACRLVRERVEQDAVFLKSMRDAFEGMVIRAGVGAMVNGGQVARLPGTSSITFPCVPASMLIANVPHICISDGPACTSGALEPSHVLLALGLSREDAECTVRISFGRGNTAAEAEGAARAITGAATRLRSKLQGIAEGDKLSGSC